MSIDYGIIIKSKTRLESLIERFNTQAQAKFYIERQDGNFEEYEEEDAIFKESLQKLQTQLSQGLKNKIVERSFLPSYLFAENNLIIVIGQDGLVANTAKYSKGVPILAVNPDKQRYDGVLLPFDTENFMEGVEQVLEGKQRSRTVSFAEAKLNDGQRLLAFNDLFIGASSHVSARYRISYGQQQEAHSSSGLIVSTKAGSTGWMSSIFNMANGMIGKSKKRAGIKSPELGEKELLFAVREPFQSIRTQTGICTGIINQQKRLRIESSMPSGGVIFSDGVEQDYLQFNSGSIAHIGIAKETANLIVNKNDLAKVTV